MTFESNQPDPDRAQTSQAFHPLEPPVVVFPQATVIDSLSSTANRAWSSMQLTLQQKTYGAPRVFDLFTLMSVTLAFGLLFACMKALDASPEVFISVTSFVTMVAMAQMMLFGGNSPRLASLVGGPMALCCVFIGLGLWYQGQAAQYLGVICLLPLGVPFGYLSGGMIAGVFLIADELRAKFSPIPAPDDGNSDSLWK